MKNLLRNKLHREGFLPLGDGLVDDCYATFTSNIEKNSVTSLWECEIKIYTVLSRIQRQVQNHLNE